MDQTLAAGLMPRRCMTANDAAFSRWATASMRLIGIRFHSTAIAALPASVI
jgi:hypothetical protein